MIRIPFLRMMIHYSNKVLELSHTSASEEVYVSLSYLNAKEKEMLIYLLQKHIYEFTPIELSKLLHVTNKTVINRCAGLAENGFLQPVLVKQRIRSYKLTDFSITNKDLIFQR